MLHLATEPCLQSRPIAAKVVSLTVKVLVGLMLLAAFAHPCYGRIRAKIDIGPSGEDMRQPAVGDEGNNGKTRSTVPQGESLPKLPLQG